MRLFYTQQKATKVQLNEALISSHRPSITAPTFSSSGAFSRSADAELLQIVSFRNMCGRQLALVGTWRTTFLVQEAFIIIKS